MLTSGADAAGSFSHPLDEFLRFDHDGSGSEILKMLVQDRIRVAVGQGLHPLKNSSMYQIELSK